MIDPVTNGLNEQGLNVPKIDSLMTDRLIDLVADRLINLVTD
jgi:hypothetical protein